MKADTCNFLLRDASLKTEEKDGKKFIRGLIPYNTKSLDFGWGFFEIIAPTAFNKTLADGANVRALFNHNTSQILGSTEARTLVLENTKDGLLCEVELPKTSYAQDLFEIIDRGDCRTMSFGFDIIKCEYEEDNAKDIVVRTLNEVKLHEVSFGVMNAAYQDTTSETEIRSLLQKDVKKMSEQEKEKILLLATEIRSIEPVGTEPDNTTPEPTQEPDNTTQTEVEQNAEAEKIQAEAFAIALEMEMTLEQGA